MLDNNSIILQFARNAKRLSLDRLRRDAIIENSELLEGLNVNQVRLGVASDGSDQAEYKSDHYADEKSSRSTYLAPYPIADLYDTGSFLKQVFMVIQGQEVKFDSLDGKRDKLVEQYRPIFGLTPLSMKVARIHCTNIYVETVYNELNA